MIMGIFLTEMFARCYRVYRMSGHKKHIVTFCLICDILNHDTNYMEYRTIPCIYLGTYTKVVFVTKLLARQKSLKMLKPFHTIVPRPSSINSYYWHHAEPTSDRYSKCLDPKFDKVNSDSSRMRSWL